MDGIHGKIIIITGASEGIGRALAIKLSEAGAKLMLAARNLERLQQLADELDGDVGVYACDVSDQVQCKALVAATLAQYNGIDIVVNNAGITMWGRFDEMQDLAIYQRMMQVNYLGAVYLTHAALPALKASKGSIATVASIAGLTGVPYRTGYAASKHAIIGFFDSLRIELKDDGIDITVICPDFVITETHKRAIGSNGKALGETPMNESKLMTAAQCAELCLHAISNRQRLLITSLRGRLGRWFKLLVPGLIDRIADRAIRNRH
ncbi:MAG: short-subunit dehydrogenase [Moritella dasanensis]|jgi:short-subunit dehydrogenase